jgi:hypothetical protein
MKGRFREIVRQVIVDSQAAPLPDLTQRGIRVPSVPGKSMAVVGMRRSSHWNIRLPWRCPRAWLFGRPRSGFWRIDRPA